LGATDHGARALAVVVDRLLYAPTMASTLQRALLHCLGALAKVVHPAVLAATVDTLITRYEGLGRDESGAGPVVASCLYFAVSRAGDRLIDDTTWTRLLACAYVGTFDAADATAAEGWGKVS
jgi:hypothetical protein